MVRPRVRVTMYSAYGLLGIVILYSALAEPPLSDSFLGSGYLMDDSGVHLDSDGTIDYFKRDSKRLFENALPVFVIAIMVGVGLVLKAGLELRDYIRSVY